MKYLIAAASFFFCASLSAQTIQQAEAMWRAHDYDGAKNVFENLLKAHPQNADYRVRYGQLLFERFNPVDAEKLYGEALELDPKNARAYLALAELLADDFDPKAEEAAQKALELNPKLYEAHGLLARMALEDDNQKKALTEADAALAIEPTALEAIAVHTAIDLLADKESPWAAKIGNRAKGYETVAHFFVINRRYEDGIVWYKKAIAADPEIWSAHSQLGVSLMRLGRPDDARAELELCYENHYRDAATVNSLRLLDTYKDFVTYKTPYGTLVLNKKEADALRPYFEGVIKHATEVYEKKYEFKLKTPLQVEVYPNHEDFAVRTMGLPGVGGILGVTFNDVVAMDSPSGRPPGSFHWAGTLWHEMSHVYILTLTNDRVPRWFTEGLAVHEESATNADWGDRITPEIVAAIRDKKLLPVAEIDRGFVHPSFPTQVIVSYFEAGKMCDYIAERWGEKKLLDIAKEFAGNRPTVDVIRDQLKMEPEAFDKDFLADLNKQASNIVTHFQEWTTGIGELNKMARDPNANNDELIAKGRALEAMYPDYVELGNAYAVVAKACQTKGDKACALEELGKYSKTGGRDTDSIKQYAKLLDDAGKPKEAEAALERLNFISPLDSGLHETLGSLYLRTNNADAAVREYQVLIALHPIDVAGSHYNLAKAYVAQGQKVKAREEVLNALEAAPEYRPAQKLLLEVSGESDAK